MAYKKVTAKKPKKASKKSQFNIVGKRQSVTSSLNTAKRK